MRYLNYAKKSTDIKAVFLVHKNEFNQKNIELNLMSFLPDALRESTLILSMDNDDSYEGVINRLLKLPEYITISICDPNLYKHITKVRTLPKQVGVLSLSSLLPNRYIQYFNFSAKALYMHANLNHNRKCFTHVEYYYKNGVPLVTQLPRILRTPKNKQEVIDAFKYLLKRPILGADIEATSLKFYKAKLVSISFAIDEQKGFTFHVKNCDFLHELKWFFRKYQGKLVWHNGSYDIKLLAYLLFNSDSRELFRTYEDTLFLHYICTNSPERFPRDLGTLVVDLCGDYKLTKQEYSDMMAVDVQKICEYNLDDARGTLWLYFQWRHRIHSEYLYAKFKDWQWYLTQTELAGIPFSRERMEEVDLILTNTIKTSTKKLLAHPKVIAAMGIIRNNEVDALNAKRVKQIEYWEKDLHFNPNSSKHMQVLLYDVLKMPSFRKTKTGESTDAATLKYFEKRADPEDAPIFEWLDEIAKADKMQSTFIKALRENSYEKNGWWYLHGSYNLAKVVSGRLSSSDPNLQNMPSGTKLGKLFKSIFSAPKGFRWGGADFASLEERINTILTKDPNKEAVYVKGYDGHSYRAFNYFPSELKEIHEEVMKVTNTPENVPIYQVTIKGRIYYGKAGDFIVDSQGSRKPIEDFL